MNDSINNLENWKLLTVSRGGAVSLLKGLTKEKAQQLAKDLRYDPWRDIDTTKVSTIKTYPNEGDIIRTEAFE